MQFVALKIVKAEKHYREAAEDEVKLLDKVRHLENESENDSESTREDKAVIEGDDPSEWTLIDACRLRVVQLYDHFKIQGPHGQHICMVFEVLGPNLLKFIQHYEYRGIPLPFVKKIARQILQGLFYLHDKCHIIHTDLKPENVLLCCPDHSWLDSLASETDVKEDPLAIDRFAQLPLGKMSSVILTNFNFSLCREIKCEIS